MHSSVVVAPAVVVLGALLLGASVQAAATPASRRTISVAATTHARGDEVLEELVKSALSEQAELRVVDQSAPAELVGRLAVTRSSRGTTLSLVVRSRAGVQLVQARRTTRRGESLVAAAQAIAAEIAQAAAGDAETAPFVAEVPSAPALAQPAPRAASPAQPSAPVAAPAPGPVPEAARAAAPAVREPQRAVRTEVAPAAPSPAPPAGDDWSGQHTRPGPADHPKRVDFIAGVELGGGPWLLNPDKIVAGSSAGYDLTHYAPAFTKTIDGRWHPGVGLHGGCSFLSYLAFEAAVQSSLWSGPGGALLAGVRASGFPLAALWPARKFDLGLELGGGYVFLGGGAYDMSGSYFTVGLTGELPLNPWMGVTVLYRLYTPFLHTFYVDYKGGRSEPTDGVTAYWHTFGLGLNLHPSFRW